LNTQLEIINRLNDIYPGLDLQEHIDPYSTYDAENDRYIVEIKSRTAEYDSWIIEKKKFDSNIIKSVETGKTFVYLSEYNGKIMTWNIHRLVRKNYDFKWEERSMPKTTEFLDNESITKQVGYLYEQDAKIHKEKE
jgi:hypothetical protein|tara:strand:+ start:142 stop:549 length:408 start_codon:yes stop_codon:yes gene_type:complete